MLFTVQEEIRHLTDKYLELRNLKFNSKVFNRIGNNFSTQSLAALVNLDEYFLTEWQLLFWEY